MKESTNLRIAVGPDDRTATAEECAVTVFFPNTIEGRTAACKLYNKLSKERDR